MGPHFLDKLFNPRAIAMFGASNRADAVGTLVYENLLAAGFKGPVFAINPKHSEINGKPCYPNLDAIDKNVDLAVISTPAHTVPDIIHACGEHGVSAAIVLSAGFGEQGDAGNALQDRILDTAARYKMRIMGPNCLGLINPRIGLNATFSKNTAHTGHLALISQSGALCTAILDWAEQHQVGFSSIVSLGDAADIDFGDVLDYLAMDPQTHSILLYVEGVNQSRRFMSGLRAAARLKPVITLKAGRHAEGSRAAMSHTGALVGADDVFDAALRRAGVVRAMSIEQLFSAAQVLASDFHVSGDRLAIITNGGGPGVMATDRAVELCVKMAELSPETINHLNQVLPAAWPRANPVDILGDAGAERYGEAVRTCLRDDAVDGALVMLTPQAMTRPLEAAEAVIAAAAESDKPVLACWMGGQQVAGGVELFSKNRIPAFPNPEAAVEAFAYLASYKRNQELLVQVPAPLAYRSEPDIEGARMIIEGALAEHRSTLSGSESKAILHAFGIPVSQSVTARSANEALVIAESLGFPVAMKIDSSQVTHKSDVNGVRLNITDAQTVRRVFNSLTNTVDRDGKPVAVEGVTVERMYHRPSGRELLVGVTRDPVFGPAITFGTGGTAVEVHRDRAVELPPLNAFIARDLIARTRISRQLRAFRHMPAVDEHALIALLRRVSELVCEIPEIVELDINPVIADESGVLAVDARMSVEVSVASADRYDHMAIHPYPSQLISHFQMGGGTDVTVRPIRPEDADMVQEFVRRLSPESRYFRFMQTLKELSRETLIRLTQIDYHRELALIAVTRDADGEREIGVARYAMNPDGDSCEFALVVDDDWQHRGIGSRLMKALIEAARMRGFRTMEGSVLSANSPMLDLTRDLGFSMRSMPDEPDVKLVSLRL